MKKAALLFILSAFTSITYAQIYYVTYLKGAVFYNNKPLKLRDKVEDIKEVYSKDEHAEVALFNAQKGQFRTSFATKVPPAEPGRHSELYRLILESYLTSFAPQTKQLETKAIQTEDFDLKKYLYGVDYDQKILLVEGQFLPSVSASWTLGAKDKFFVRFKKGGLTVRNLMEPAQEGLIISATIFKGLSQEGVRNVNCSIIHGYYTKAKYHESIVVDSVNVTLLSRTDLSKLVDIYKEGLVTFYNNDKDRLVNDIEQSLTIQYGAFYKSEIEGMIVHDLSK